ncbi:MAG: AraC family transcriptional regulator [Erysipelotrichales bacterium]|nr:AraC family transcriptional regulator [Erysipelotrichales bacterium]
MSNNRINIIDDNFFDHKSQLMYVSYSKFGQDWKSLKHFHPFTEIFLVLDGEGTFTVENKSFDIKTNDLIIVLPNVYHQELSHDNKPLEYAVLGVKDLLFQVEDSNQNFIFQNFDKDNQDILYYFHHLLMESENKEIGYDTVCQKLLELLILKIIRKMNINLQAQQAFLPVKREIRMICHYIDQNYSEDLSLESLAQYMKMNKYYMAHEFKKYMHISPIQYLIKRRIEECQSLLKTSSLSVSEISEAVGFSSQSYFSQIFKKEIGMTPLEYRQSNTQDYNTQDIQKKFVINQN